jgi:hypothetical protein
LPVRRGLGQRVVGGGVHRLRRRGQGDHAAARRLGDPEPGIGDSAYLRQDSIVASRGDVAVTIRLQGRAADPGKPDALRQLTTAAVSRL